MKIRKSFITGLILLFTVVTNVSAQRLPADIARAIRSDDAAQLNKLVTKDSVNVCFGNYSLSESIRARAFKCFNLLIEKGADVNRSCNGYVPPLMHAAKYGSLEMVKILVAKGADVHYKYESDFAPGNGPVKGDTPLIYAERWKHPDILEYLKTVLNVK